MKTSQWHQKINAEMTAFRCFLSSGTSQGDRSISPFSRDGLHLYDLSLLTGFFDLLAKCFPDHDPPRVPGLSLIPPASVWASSSLAYMVTRLASHFRVAFTTVEGLRASLEAHQRNAPGQPIWVFGTALHFLHLMEKEPEAFRSLPPDALLIETGGPKSSSRQLTHEAFLDMLRGCLTHPRQAIASEYSMCELASQAYGLLGQEQRISLRFPAWVEVKVVQPGNRAAASGVGALSILDPLRVDLGFALRTQDIVELAEDGSFFLLGRVPQSVLKGCSLNVEDVPPASDGKSRVQAQATHPGPPGDRRLEPGGAGMALQRHLSAFLSSPPALDALSAEIGGFRALARRELEVLARTLPASPGRWREFQQAAWFGDSTNRPGARGLFLAPKNHSLALLESIVCALSLGHSVAVRLPGRIGHMEAEKSLLAAFIEAMQSIKGPWACNSLPASFRLDDAGQDMSHDYIYLHGEDSTLATVKSLAKRPVYGHGHAWAAAILDATHALDAAPLLIRQMLHLGQLGCQSLRLIALMVPHGEAAALQLFAAALRQAFRDQLGADLGLRWQLALDHAALAFRRAGFGLMPFPANGQPYDAETFKGPLLPVSTLTAGDHLSSRLAAGLYTLPLVITALDAAALAAKITQTAGHCYLFTDDQASGSQASAVAQILGADRLKVCKLGDGAEAPWTGRHQGAPLFRNA